MDSFACHNRTQLSKIYRAIKFLHSILTSLILPFSNFKFLPFFKFFFFNCLIFVSVGNKWVIFFTPSSCNDSLMLQKSFSAITNTELVDFTYFFKADSRWRNRSRSVCGFSSLLYSSLSTALKFSAEFANKYVHIAKRFFRLKKNVDQK